MSQVIGARRAGVPSPEGNPKIRELYGRGTGKLPQKIFGDGGNERLVPVAMWAAIRLHIEIDKAGVLNLAFADGRGVELGPRVPASETLTGTANFANTETVTIDTKVYTFETTLTNVDGNVLVGADLEESIENLVAAITLGAGSGTAYAAATTLHPTATAAKGSATTMVATAKSGGTSGNSIATTETGSNASWGNTTMQGGVDGALTADETAIVANTPLEVTIPGVENASPEHIGEPYLIVSVAGLTGDAAVEIFDVMGASF
jgi:hypothetical protein